ncbi:MAG: S1 RNA-binding domain-containing protein [Eubacteriales bacterium]|nr:S1 RNA-binding domain-containing protein [Eubacteriales bacterium]
MKPEIGQIYEGKITSITNFGAFVTLPDGPDGMVHISEVSDGFVKDINDVLKVGETVKVKVISISDNGKIALSIKKAVDRPKRTDAPQHKDFGKNDGQRPIPQQSRSPKKPQERKPAPMQIITSDGVWEESVSSDPNFEDMMSKFKKSSQDRMSDLKRGNESRGYSRRGHGGRK